MASGDLPQGDVAPTQQPETPPQTPVAPPGGAGTGEPGTEEKEWAMFAHIGGIVLSFIGPLIMYTMKKGESKFVEDQAREALNFQLNLLPFYLISIILMFIVVGFLTFIAIFVLSVLMGIQAAMRANKGEWYRYPVILRLVK